MPFKENNKYGKGRPPGSLNAIDSEIKAAMEDFWHKNFDRLAKNIDKGELSEWQQWQILTRFNEYLFPKLRAESLDLNVDFMQLSPEDIEKLADQVVRNNKLYYDKE